MSQSMEKPFYFQPPLSILFEIQRLEKIMPWDVNISFLLTTFLEEMEHRGEVDFRASGIALESSSIIYLMKSKLLLELEEPPPPPKSLPEFLPPPMFLPLRYELSSTTLENLLNVLDEVLKGERLGPSPPPSPPPVIPTTEIIPSIDLYLVEIEERMKNLYSQLSRLAGKAQLVGFSKLVAGLERLEAVKTFIVLLFLAQRGKIGLWQEDDISELYITVAGDPTFEGRGTGIV